MNNRLQELREKRGLSKSALSRISGVSRPTIVRLESQEETVVKTETLEKLAGALNVSIKTLFLPDKFNKVE